MKHLSKRSGPQIAKTSHLKRHSRHFRLNVANADAYKLVTDVLKAEKIRIDAHNPPAGGMFQLGSRPRLTNFGLKAIYRGDFSLTSVSDDVTAVEIAIRPRLRIGRNVHALLPVAALPLIFGPWGLLAGLGVSAMAVWMVVRHKPASSLERMTRALSANIVRNENLTRPEPVPVISMDTETLHTPERSAA